MKPRSKTSRKPLKKKQNGKRTTKRTTKKNTKKHKQTHQARSKKSRGMIGGVNVNESNDNKSNNEHNHTTDEHYKWNMTHHEREQAEREWAEQVRWQSLAEGLHRGPRPRFLKAYFVGVGGLAVVLYALFGNDLN